MTIRKKGLDLDVSLIVILMLLLMSNMNHLLWRIGNFPWFLLHDRMMSRAGFEWTGTFLYDGSSCCGTGGYSVIQNLLLKEIQVQCWNGVQLLVDIELAGNTGLIWF